MLHSHLSASETMIRRFEREWDILGRLPDGVTARLLGHRKTEMGTPYFVMGRLAGEDLGAWLRRVGGLEVTDAPPVLQLLAAALDAAHTRPEKPLTQTAWVLGSPGYLAPEHARGENDKIGAASDVFALGAIAYRMSTGENAFRARAASDTLPPQVTAPTRA